MISAQNRKTNLEVPDGYGGEEERGILNNFPADMQTAETALLFLQLIMRKLKRPLRGKPGRAAVVVPNGILFGDGVCARIKEELLKEFNLHTIVRLPEGTFAPYTDIPANLLFFDRSGASQTVQAREKSGTVEIQLYRALKDASERSRADKGSRTGQPRSKGDASGIVKSATCAGGRNRKAREVFG